MVIHPQARTTPKLRAEIKAQRDRKQVDLAKQYNVTPQTIRKWQNRDEFTDKSHRPHRLQTKLSEHQEMLVVELRKLLLLPLDDLLVIVREFIHPEATRSGIHRTLRRHGVSNLNALLRAENEEEAQPAKRKTFKDYAPGFVHVDVKYLPQMADESRRTYLFVAIDRATRWVYLEILPDKSARSAKGFLKQLIKKAPFIITRVLTDNGKEFTDRFIANGERKPTGQHPFDQVCQAEGIEHRLIKPKHPQTNGMVERFNGRISEILATTHFDASRDLQETLYQYQKIYNYHVPQKNIGHITPIQALIRIGTKNNRNYSKRKSMIYRDLTTFRHHQIIPGTKGRGSASDVKKLLVHEQRVYIGTLQGLFYLDMKDNRVRSISTAGLQSGRSMIYDLLLMPEGNILVSTSWGVFSLDPETLQLKQKYLHITAPYGSGTNALFHDSRHRLWVSTDKHGVLLIDEHNKRLVRHFEHDEDDPDSLRFWNALSFTEDVWGNVWIGSNNGLNLYLDADDKIITLADFRKRPSGVHDHSIQILYSDSNQNIWIGTSVGGVSRLSPYLARFSKIIPANDLQTPDKRLLGIVKTPEGGLYVGTSVGLAYRPPGKTAFRIVPTADHQALAAKTTAYGLFMSRDGTLWVGSSTGLRRLPPGEKKLQPPELSNPYYFIKMLEDSEGYLWLGRPTELLKYDPRTRKIVASLQLPHTYGMLQLDTSRILVGGLGKIHLIDTRTATVLDAIDGETHGFNSITYLYQARDGSIWVGTQGDGLFHMELDTDFDLSRAKLTFYSMQQELASNAIGAIAESANGLIWFTTTRSITRLDPTSGAIQNFNDKDGAFSEGYYIGSGLQDDQGLIYFGGVKGMSIFSPEWITDDPVTPRVIFTELRLDNHPMSVGIPASPLSRPIAYTDHLTIEPRWPSITLEFASNNYASPKQIRYAYRMEGLEEEWTETSAGARFANYASMPPGNYRFLVQVCLRPRDRFWDIPVPKIDSAFDNLFVPQTSWSPSTTQQPRKLVAAPYLAPI